MKKIVCCLIVSITLSTFIYSYALDIELSGEVAVNSLKFPDGTTQTSAVGAQGPQGPQGPAGHSPTLGWSGDQISIDGFVWGPHLTGPQGPQGPAAPTAPERILYINKLEISDFQPIWFTQGNSWQAFNPSFELVFNKLSESSIVRVEWSDNVGIYGSKWCNIGLFLDDHIVTGCSGAWSGVPNTTVFNQQNLKCIFNNVSTGQHKITVKHRSQYCVYGNYAFDQQGSYRLLMAEEQN